MPILRRRGATDRNQRLAGCIGNHVQMEKALSVLQTVFPIPCGPNLDKRTSGAKSPGLSPKSRIQSTEMMTLFRFHRHIGTMGNSPTVPAHPGDEHVDGPGYPHLAIINTLLTFGLWRCPRYCHGIGSTSVEIHSRSTYLPRQLWTGLFDGNPPSNKTKTRRFSLILF